MSLTSHIEMRTTLGQFLLDQVMIPDLPEFVNEDPIITHKYDRYSLLGTAFDYLIRMSLASQEGIDFYPKIAGKAIAKYRSQTDSGKLKNLHSRRFLKCNKATKKAILEHDLRSMAQNSLSFARLDPFIRSSKWNEDWNQQETDKLDIEELLVLHQIWIKSFTIPKGDILLNPSFKNSKIFEGADADLIAGENIIDWKVVNNPKRDIKKSLAQMIGYSILRILDGKTVSNCIVYFARHGKQLSIPLDKLTKNTTQELVNSFEKLTKRKRLIPFKRKKPSADVIEPLITTGIKARMKEERLILKTKFSIFKGVGPAKEKKIYSSGIKNWNDYVDAKEIEGISSKLHDSICNQIERWEKAVKNREHSFFFQNLQKSNHWMLFSLLLDNVCYLDIETTGLSLDYHNITLIGIFDGTNYDDLVRGENLSKRQLQTMLMNCKLLVTYNGSCFDIPFLVKEFGITLEIPHFDLCFGGRKVGLTGGLKSIERQLGISREQEISSVNGFEAVELWHSHKRGNQRALKKLRNYCREDTINLSKLAPIIFANLSERYKQI